ncbi:MULTISPECIES: hypothetical protein [unclassified Clostridium]|uniref:hypothetical protein n=1 Tax=unclassified Clostridium TaxID=2614128 RepID=UPI0002978E61|nr:MULTISPECIES: hypothetical protein [unclassified Clostridium]EKQ52689.1 MAG: hypothetical protein A370_04110 [Clostridium sp. Maddingley MBC34-26]
MARKKTSNIIKNDFEYDEGEVFGFTSEVPTGGNCISSFSFDDDSALENTQANPECKSTNDTAAISDLKINAQENIISDNSNTQQCNISDSIEIQNSLSSAKEIFDNRRTPIPNGAAPAIDGETPIIKRSYILRSSTIRKINELKSIHPDISVCVSTIVDIAIDYYHNHILNEGGNQ